MDYVALFKLLSFFITYPIFLMLTYIGHLLLAIVAPFVHLAQYVLHGCMWPLRFLAKFETLYIYVGVALLVGVATGATLHYASAFLTGLMNLESQPEEEPRGRTVASYRARRTDKLQQQKTRPPMIPPIVTSPKIEGAFKDEFAKLRERDTQPRRSLLTSTILEEDDSSDERF